MAKYPSLTFTQKGTQMLVQAQNGHIMTFTCGKLGSGVLSDSDDISQFADLKAPKMTLPITKADDSNPEKIVLTFDTSNTTLETGFVSRELGIFAKLDDGTETLYAYSNAGNNYDYIPSKDTPSDENRLVVNLVVSSSASIAVTVDQSIVYAHMSDVVEKITAHDSTSDAHTALAATIDDTIVPKSDTNTIRNLLDNLANRIKTATGASGWKEAPAATLASLSMMIANLATGADVTWDGKKFTNNRLGITGLMDQNGYICFGPNFGGLIIQWAFFYNVPIGSQWTFPISFKEAYVVVGNDVNSKDFTTSTQVNTFYELKASSVKLGAVTIDRRTTTFFGRVMAIGKG